MLHNLCCGRDPPGPAGEAYSSPPDSVAEFWKGFRWERWEGKEVSELYVPAAHRQSSCHLRPSFGNHLPVPSEDVNP